MSVFVHLVKRTIGAAKQLGYNQRTIVVPAMTVPIGSTKPQPANSPPNATDRLDSWKEIAAYLKRDERTVRRWEAEGLPIHRKVHKKQASVYAYRTEIDAWWHDGQRRLEKTGHTSSGKRSIAWTWALAGLVVGGLGFAGFNIGGLRDRLLGKPAVQRIQSIAVLPLENLSKDPDQDYFADGMTDELITDLAKIKPVRVISRTSSMRYKGTNKSLSEIALELNVDAVVEGSVTRSSERVRITAQLIDARSDRHLWAENYDRPVGDVVGLQNEIAAAIASRIRGEISSGPNSVPNWRRQINPAAYDAYLQGRHHFNKRTEADLKIAVDDFSRAITLEPDYALAYVGLADSYNILGSWVFTSVPRSDARSKAMTYAEKALAIDETLGEAHTSLGDAKLLFDLDWRGSEAEFRRGLELSPNYANAHHWYAELLLDWGRFDESIRESYVARELDPMSAMMNSALASRLCAAHRCSDGVGDAMLAVELDPNLPLAHSILAELYLAQGQAEKSIVETQKAVRFSGRNPNFLAELAYVYAVSGDRENARKILSSLSAKSKTGYVAPYQLAAVYTALGDKRHALAKLYEAYEEHSPWLDNLYLDSLEGGRLIDLRTEPRFVELLRRIGPPRS